MNWIKCSVALPATSKYVLVYDSGTRSVRIAWWGNKWNAGTHSTLTFNDDSVTHWQPLPEPPKETNND